MKLLSLLLALGLSFSALAQQPNSLTTEEEKAGWRLLFDGKTLNGWRSFGKQSAPSQGWVVEKGLLHLKPGSKAGDIITTDKFEEFELEWDWRIAPKANNGLKYFILEERKQAIGHEYQMIDDSTAPQRKHLTASFYDVLPPSTSVKPNPPGEWNTSRILVQGKTVTHWLNREKALEYTFGDVDLKKALAMSKFKDVAGFGERQKGHILLTDHNDEVWYRSIKIRDLSGKAPAK
ncbi:MAG TPA: DUF1080 domain-containing protein [Methylomirabilota bacterium]|nr:DUF1080 domain-containing protein [Methylomirabilota bacterium]